MADPVKRYNKIVVIGVDNTPQKSQIAFNAAIVTANATAAGLAYYPGAVNQPSGTYTGTPTTQDGYAQITNDPVTMTYDGTNYTIMSAVNYIDFV